MKPVVTTPKLVCVESCKMMPQRHASGSSDADCRSHIRHRAERGPQPDGPPYSSHETFSLSGNVYQRGQFREDVVRMLVIGPTALRDTFPQSEKARGRRDAARSTTQPKTSAGEAVFPTMKVEVLFHEHKVIRRLRFALAAWPALMVVGNENHSVKHQLPAVGRNHPHGFGHRSGLPKPCLKTHEMTASTTTLLPYSSPACPAWSAPPRSCAVALIS